MGIIVEKETRKRENEEKYRDTRNDVDAKIVKNRKNKPIRRCEKWRQYPLPEVKPPGVFLPAGFQHIIFVNTKRKEEKIWEQKEIILNK